MYNEMDPDASYDADDDFVPPGAFDSVYRFEGILKLLCVCLQQFLSIDGMHASNHNRMKQTIVAAATTGQSISLSTTSTTNGNSGSSGERDSGNNLAARFDKVATTSNNGKFPTISPSNSSSSSISSSLSSYPGDGIDSVNARRNQILKRISFSSSHLTTSTTNTTMNDKEKGSNSTSMAMKAVFETIASHNPWSLFIERYDTVPTPSLSLPLSMSFSSSLLPITTTTSTSNRGSNTFIRFFDDLIDFIHDLSHFYLHSYYHRNITDSNTSSHVNGNNDRNPSSTAIPATAPGVTAATAITQKPSATAATAMPTSTAAVTQVPGTSTGTLSSSSSSGRGSAGPIPPWTAFDLTVIHQCTPHYVGILQAIASFTRVKESIHDDFIDKSLPLLLTRKVSLSTNDSSSGTNALLVSPLLDMLMMQSFYYTPGSQSQKGILTLSQRRIQGCSDKAMLSIPNTEIQMNELLTIRMKLIDSLSLLIRHDR